MAFAPARKPYPTIGLLFTPKNGDFGAISATESEVAYHRSLNYIMESNISGRCSYYTP